MAFDDILPKNSESRALSIALRIIKKEAPHIKWIISFADATQSGHGTIYQATGFILTQIKKNSSMWINKLTGQRRQDMQFYHMMTKKGGNWEKAKGYMLRYIYFLQPECLKLLVPAPIPYDKIKEMGIGMYLGKNLRQ